MRTYEDLSSGERVEKFTIHDYAKVLNKYVRTKLAYGDRVTMSPVVILADNEWCPIPEA